jgi:two-component system, LuxR family, response regulator FixJ
MPTNVVHLIDDDDGVRLALAFLLTSSGFAVRVYESASAFLDSLPVQPGCIVTDVRMPGISGVELQRQLKTRQIGLPLIVMTGHGDVALAVAAMKAGAIDFIEKPFPDETLIDSIQGALDRHAKAARQDQATAATAAKLKTLTACEREILDGLVAGRANKSIAYDLQISARTVEVHRANVMTKMGAASLPELIRMIVTIQSAAPSL